MSQPIIIGSVIVYAIIMFAIAWAADRRGAKRLRGSALIYGLSIGVYCTSWTFYGAVGTAETRGWEYLPIYLGPLIVFSVGAPLLRRIVEVGKRIHSTSIADFISAHYGKSRSIAALVATVAVIGALPYIALQLKSVATTFAYLAHGDAATSAGASFGGIVAVAATLAAFAIMFGTRHIDITRHNRGMIAAIAFDSVIKIVALAAVGLFALMLTGGLRAADVSAAFAADVSLDRFATLTVLSMAAILCLPRQFHVTVVECQDEKHLGAGRAVFLAYLAVISVLVIPIAVAGAGSLEGVAPDLTVLALPLSQGAEGLALGVFVGGFAAATAMVIVACVALSTMIANDLVGPFLVQGQSAGSTPSALGRRLLQIRRVSIIALLGVGALFAAFAPEGEQLASFGILSFAAVAQYVPALLGALYWRGAKPAAAFWAIFTGFILWAVLLFAPSYFGAGAETLAAPLAFLDGTGWDPLTRGVVLSLGANTLVFIGLSLRGVPKPSVDTADSGSDPRLRAGDLYVLIQRCLGEDDGKTMINAFEVSRGRLPDPQRIAGPALIAFADRQISKAIGASSASILLKSVLAGGSLQLDDVATLLGETTGKVSFSQELLQTTLENISHGVSVVDADLKLVAWNAAYIDMYALPPSLMQDGRPIADLIRYNAERGECGPGDVEAQVERRLEHLRAGRRHTFERARPDGTVVRIEGARSPSGAYVTTYTDVTDYKRVQGALEESEQSIRFYTDNIPAMASYVDTDERLLFANNAYRMAFGIQEQEIGRTTLKDVLAPEVYAERRAHIAAALRGERVTFDADLTVNGQTQFMQVSYAPQKGADGRVRGFFGVYQDVTARRAAERALARTNETLEERVAARTQQLHDLNLALDEARRQAESATASKTRFLAAASHDVLQPLNAARLFVSALKETDDATAPETGALLDKTDASIASADRLLRALLNISKLDAGGMEPDVSDFSLNTVFKELANDFAILAAEKGVTFRVVETTLWVRSDRGLLVSALQNIVANAIRYTDDGGVLIGVRRRGGAARIEVHDTGRGIPDARRRDIFQEFKRLERDADVAGAGLGLAMVDRIVRLLNVDLELRSREGQGSSFAIATPKAAARTEAEPKARPAPAGALDGLTVYCIDDDPMVVDAMLAALTRWGADAAGYASDAALLSSAKAGAAPDILLLDYQLEGGRTGFDALNALEAHWGGRPLTIMITASSSGEAERRAADLGIPVLTKPVEPGELRALISQSRKMAAE